MKNFLKTPESDTLRLKKASALANRSKWSNFSAEQS